MAAFAVALAIEFVDELADGTKGAALPLIRADLGLSYSQIGLLISVPLLVGSLIELPLGLVAGQGRTRHRLVLAGGVVVAGSLAAVAAAHSLGVLLVAFVAFFPASGAFVSLTQAALMDAAPRRHQQRMAAWNLAGSAGAVGGPLLLAGVLAVGGGWRMAYLLLGAAAGAALAVAFLAAPSRQRRPATPSSQRRPATPSSQRRPATPSSQRRPAASPADRDPAARAADRDPAAPAADRDPAAPAADRDPAAPAADPDPVAPITDRDPASSHERGHADAVPASAGGQADQADQGEQAGQADQTDQGEQAHQADQTDQGEQADQDAGEDAAGETCETGETDDEENGERASVREALRALRRGGVARWVILLEISDLLLDVLTGYIGVYLVDVAGASPAQAAVGVAVRLGGGLAGDALFVVVSRRVSGPAALRISAVTAAILYPAFLLVPSLPAKLAILAVLSLATACWYPVVQAGLYTALPGRSGIAVFLSSAAGLLGAAGPLAVGFIAQQAGLAWALAALAAAPAAVLAILPSGARPRLRRVKR